jgi:hypothetical protein
MALKGHFFSIALKMLGGFLILNRRYSYLSNH